MKRKLLMSALLILFSSIVQANVLKHIPEKCPGVSSIITAGIEVNSYGPGPEEGLQIWKASKTSYYDTNEGWNFIFFLIAKNTEEEAIAKARSVLSTLSFNARSGDICEYKISAPPGLAVATPA